MCNRYLAPEKQIDHRSYERQGLEQIPTIHEGYVARQMEQRGKISQRMEQNRSIRKFNRMFAKLQTLVAGLGEQILKLKEDLRRVILYERFEQLQRRRATSSDGRTGTLMQGELEQKDTQIREMQAELEQLPTLSEWQKVQELLQEQATQIQEQSSIIRQQAENIEKLNANDRYLAENRQLKKENEHLATRIQTAENERDYALAKVEFAKTHMRVEHVKVPTYYEKCTSCDKEFLMRQIDKRNERYKKQRLILRAFEVLVFIVIVFTAYQEQVFWKDFKSFFMGLWKVLCVVGIAVYNGYSNVSGFVTSRIPNTTMRSVVYWILIVLLFALRLAVVIFSFGGFGTRAKRN